MFCPSRATPFVFKADPAIHAGNQAKEETMTETLALPTTGTERSEGSHGPRLGWVLVLTSAAFFMTCLDSLVVGTALPRIQESLHVGFASLQWTVNSYNIAVAAGIICAAALGDRYGRRLSSCWVSRSHGRVGRLRGRTDCRPPAVRR